MSVEKMYCLPVVIALMLSMTSFPLTSAQPNDFYYPLDGWKISTPEEYGMNATRLDDMVTYIEETPVSINSIVLRFVIPLLIPFRTLSEICCNGIST